MKKFKYETFFYQFAKPQSFGVLSNYLHLKNEDVMSYLNNMIGESGWEVISYKENVINSAWNGYSGYVESIGFFCKKEIV